MKSPSQAYAHFQAKSPQLLKKQDFYFILNKSLAKPVDPVLLREAIIASPRVAQKKAGGLAEVVGFFEQTEKQLERIEENYLPMIEELGSSDPSVKFAFNKDNVSKFLRDEIEHYQQTLKKNAQSTSSASIPISQMHAFLKDIFDTSYTNVIFQGGDYFAREDSIQHVYSKVKSYLKEKDVLEVEEDEMLDFMTFWLQDETQLFVLYGRTPQHLHREVNQMHRIQKQQMMVEDNFTGTAQQSPQMVDNPQIDLVVETKVDESKQVALPQRVLQKSSSLQANFEGGLKEYDLSPAGYMGVKLKRKNEQSKTEQLQSILPELFEFGCKNRYAMHKNLTFEDIKAEGKTMTLEKFINLCKHLQIFLLVSREKLCDLFKMHAINHRSADLSKFKELVYKIIALSAESIDNFLRKNTYDVKKKAKQVMSDRRNHDSFTGLSAYKFVLRPINGKDLESIQDEMFNKKELKSKEKEAKSQMLKSRLITNGELLLKNKQKRKRQNSSTIKLNASIVSPGNLEGVRDSNFELQKYIGSRREQQDSLWELYQAKIWRKQRGSNIIEDALQRRIENGSKVVRKNEDAIQFRLK